jgi:hypothetical protein
LRPYRSHEPALLHPWVWQALLGTILLSRSSLLELTMAKSQARSTRETRKPKAEKVKTNASKPSEKTGVVRGLDNLKNK